MLYVLCDDDLLTSIPQFVYVQQAFSPALDLELGTLYDVSSSLFLPLTPSPLFTSLSLSPNLFSTHSLSLSLLNHQCYGSSGKLVLYYSKMPAWG